MVVNRSKAQQVQEGIRRWGDVGMKLEGKWVFSLPACLLAELLQDLSTKISENLRVGSALSTGGTMANVTLLTPSSLSVLLIS